MYVYSLMCVVSKSLLDSKFPEKDFLFETPALSRKAGSNSFAPPQPVRVMTVEYELLEWNKHHSNPKCYWSIWIPSDLAIHEAKNALHFLSFRFNFSSGFIGYWPIHY
jgi:hypothetical protein